MGNSSGLAIILAGAWVFYLGMLVLLLTLPSDSNVGATANFGLSGFQENSLHPVLDSSWIFDITTGCYYLDPPDANSWYSYSGRILFPGAVQMRDPGATTVKSFSTSFIYQLRIVSSDGNTGPGLAFLIVPDNVTVGAPWDFMGLITNGTTKYYDSDNHTLGVELDAFQNPEFNDPNDNHIGLNLASMNSTFTVIPVYGLASTSADLYQQIWVDYFEADSRMEIYYAHYKQDKPAKPQGSASGLNLSLLKESMYIGFSSAKSGNFPYVCAWSFSNDGNPAPPIVLAQDATPGAPPPPATVTPPPPPAPTTPSPTPSPPRNGPVAAPSVPPSATIPSPLPGPPRSPAPSTSSPPPPLRAPNPSPFSSPNPSPPSTVPLQGPSSEPSTGGTGGIDRKMVIVGVCVGVSLFLILVGLCIFFLCCRRTSLSHPLHIFISHAGGPDGSEKNFAISLHDRLKKYRWSINPQSNITFFIDKEDIEDGEIFAEKIFKELARFDVGLVVVTDAFFEGKWPMTELIAFMEAQMKDTADASVRVIPLFYKLTPRQVRSHLEAKTWEPKWREWSTGKHPLDVETCRNAVSLLCGTRGILYRSEQRDYDHEYIEEICTRLNKTLRKERNSSRGQESTKKRWSPSAFRKHDLRSETFDS